MNAGDACRDESNSEDLGASSGFTDRRVGAAAFNPQCSETANAVSIIGRVPSRKSGLSIPDGKQDGHDAEGPLDSYKRFDQLKA